MTERPSGTVTFLFTDIEGSTRLLRQLGSEHYGRALDDHRRIVRGAATDAGGSEVDTQGDAFFLAFRRADDAARAAVETQRQLAAHGWPDDGRLKVRMGLHTTNTVAGDEGYVGIGVHRAARICGAAHGGQVLVSAATAELLRDAEAPIGLADLGLHRLRDLDEPEHLFQLTASGLAERFPPPRSLDNRPTNLPDQPTPLIGRRQELDDITGILRRDDVRLLTLTGAGGSGKTRIALQAGAELMDAYADGVFSVSLVTVTDRRSSSRRSPRRSGSTREPANPWTPISRRVGCCS